MIRHSDTYPSRLLLSKWDWGRGVALTTLFQKDGPQVLQKDIVTSQTGRRLQQSYLSCNSFVPLLKSIFLSIPDWPQTYNPPTSPSQVLDYRSIPRHKTYFYVFWSDWERINHCRFFFSKENVVKKQRLGSTVRYTIILSWVKLEQP